MFRLRCAFVLICIYMLCPAPVAAQEKFMESQSEDSRRIDERLGLAQPPGPDLGPVREAYLDYFKFCATAEHPFIRRPDRAELCNCSANAMLNVMSLEEIEAMKTTNPQSIKLRRKMLVEAYAPCIKDTIEPIITRLCLSDTASTAKMRDPQYICACLGDTVSRYIDRDHYNLIDRIIHQDPQTVDPLGTYLNSDEFFDINRGYMRRCLRVHESRR